MDMMKAIFNKGLARAIITVFAVALVLMPFTSISDERVHIPDKSTFMKQTGIDADYIDSRSAIASESPEAMKISNTSSVLIASDDTATSNAAIASDPVVALDTEIASGAAVIPDTTKKAKTKKAKESKKTKGVEDSEDSSTTVDDPSSNRDYIWNYLVENGYTDKQTAGIMGNLQQEHEFQTSGDGIAQWNGDRRAKLHKMKNPHSLKTQLKFLVQVELKGSYSDVNKALKACKTIDAATKVFCNRYERPGIPAMSKRLAYAHKIYERYHK